MVFSRWDECITLILYIFSVIILLYTAGTVGIKACGVPSGGVITSYGVVASYGSVKQEAQLSLAIG